jgi:hypothetical protein
MRPCCATAALWCAILGGTDIDESDYAFMAQIYPKSAAQISRDDVDDLKNRFARVEEECDVLRKALVIIARN